MVTHEKFEAKILVLDDERLIRLTICARLKHAGYESVAVATVEEAVSILKQHHRSFCAIISDIVMGDMDGFVFRDIVRGMDSSIPFFFMTALDPEEGSGFLKKIISDPMCYYLPKSAGSEVLLKRLQRVVGARRIQQFVENQMEEQNRSLALAAHVQRNMLSPRAAMDERGYYVTWWRPHEAVSGDMYEAIPLLNHLMLFVLGDIQGHGTNAALVMMALQTFLRQVVDSFVRDKRTLTPDALANQLHGFFLRNFADVSYMTALICIHALPEDCTNQSSSLSYICCGTADPVVIDTRSHRDVPVNPEKRGGLPIGLMPDTVYSEGDVVAVDLTPGSVCVASTDGQLELSRDSDGRERIPESLLAKMGMDVTLDAVDNGSIMVAPGKFMSTCSELGYGNYQDDVTVLLFGARCRIAGVYEATTPLSPTLVDGMAQAMGGWCVSEGWPDDLVQRVQLVLEEKLMNIYDHGFDDQQRRKDVVSLRLRRWRDHAELTVWDYGKQPPSMKVAAGDADTAFTLINNDMSNHGRGRLMMRQLCSGIQRQCFGTLNETIFYIPWSADDTTGGIGK